MKTSAIIRIVIWAIVALVFLGILLLGLGGYSFLNFRLNSWDAEYHEGDYKLGSGSVPVSGINRVEVDWVAGDISISPTDGSEITFEESSSHDIRESDLMYYDVSDGKLTIRYRRHANDIHFFGINRSLEKSLNVKLPRSMFEQLEILEISNVSALLSIDGVEAQNVEIDSVSGSVRLSEITCDDLEISTISGSITGDKVTARKVNSDSVSGRRTLSGSMEELNIEGISGGSDITSDICPSRVSVDTVSGSVSLTIPENDGFTAKYDKISGNVNSDFAVTHSGNSMTYKSGGAKFSFNSISGSIDVRKGQDAA